MNYDSFATIYDTTCPGVDGDVVFFANKSKELGGNILEVGCGTGRIYLELRKLGIEIEGIDSSGEMLSLLKKKAAKSRIDARVSLASITDYSLDSNFNLIFLPYRTFMHLYSKEDQMKALENIHLSLAVDGEVVIDLFNPDMDRINKGSSYIFLEKKENNFIWLWEEFDTNKQIVSNLFRVEEVDKNDKVIKTTIKEFQARWFYPDEFEKLVTAAGFKVKKVYADYFGNQFTGKEDKMIWVLGK